MRHHPNGWMHLHDLAVHMSEMCHLTFEDCRELTSAASNGCPIEIERKIGNGVEKATLVIDQLFGPAKTDHYQTEGHLYYRTWGKSGPIYVKDIISVKVPKSTYILNGIAGETV